MSRVRALLIPAFLLLATAQAASMVWGLATREIALDAIPADEPWRPKIETREAPPPPREESYPETLARPVFAPTRRPPAPKVEEPEPEAPAADPPASEPPEPEPVAPRIAAEEFLLTGVIIRENGRQALLRSPSAPDGAWVEIGADLDGWRLTAIEPGSATISAGEESRTLPLYGAAPP